MGLFYTLEIDESQISIRLQLASEAKRSFYIDTIAGFCDEQDRRCLPHLIKAHLKAAGHLAKTRPINQIKVRGDDILSLLKEIASSGKLMWKGRNLRVDFFTPVRFTYNVESSGDNRLVRGALSMPREILSIEKVDTIFLGEPGFFIHEHFLYFLPKGLHPKWVRKVQNGPWALSLREWVDFRENFEEGPPLGGPEVRWGDSLNEEMQPQRADPVPQLHLKDQTGMLADLWLSYGDESLWAFADHSLKTSGGLARDKEKEKSFEKDLLEGGFRKKGSSYCCSSVDAAQLLEFFLELEWKIFDSAGRQLLLPSKEEVHLFDAGAQISMEGEVFFGDFPCSIKELFTALRKNRLTMPLGEKTAALLNREKPLFKVLSSEELIADAEQISLKKRNVGLLKSVNDASFFWDKALAGLKSFVQGEAAPLEKDLRLYAFQQKGVEWMHFLSRCHFGGILADEMGLGKTIQALSFLATAPEKGPHLVVAPYSVIHQWVKEKERFFPSCRHEVYLGKDRAIGHCEILFTTYGILQRDSDALKEREFSFVIFDEAQRLKNPESKTFKAAQALKRKSSFALTGTPIENSIIDLWALLEIVMEGFPGEKRAFVSKMSDPSSELFAKEKKRMVPFLLRRTKAEVDVQLPEKEMQLIWTQMSEDQEKLYKALQKEIKQKLLSKIEQEGAAKNRMHILEGLLRLRQICCHPSLYFKGAEEDFSGGKFERCLEDVDELSQGGHKIVLYSQFTEMLAIFRDAFEKKGIPFVYLDGSTKDRASPVQKFQEDPSIPLFLISLKAGGVGLNLSAADYVLLYDPWWNEAVENQAIDRAHRLGREKKVIARKYVAMDSIEEKVMALKEKKKGLIEPFFEGSGEGGALNLEEILSLLE